MPLFNSLLHIKDDKFLIISISCFFFSGEEYHQWVLEPVQPSGIYGLGGEGIEAAPCDLGAGEAQSASNSAAANQSETATGGAAAGAAETAASTSSPGTATEPAVGGGFGGGPGTSVGPDGIGGNAFACDNIKELFAPNICNVLR